MIDRIAQGAQRALAAQQHCDAARCPDADTLIAFAEGRLAETERMAVAAKVAACAGCAAALRVALDAAPWAADLAADLERSEVRNPVVALPVARHPRRRTWLRLAMAAGVAALSVGLLLRPAPSDRILRGGPTVVTTPADGTRLAAAPERLVWPCAVAPDAAVVELLGVDAAPRWSGPALECAATLPQATREALAEGEYLWRVKNAAGAVLLGPIAFRIEP